MVSPLRVGALLVLAVVFVSTALPVAGSLPATDPAGDGPTDLQDAASDAAQAQSNNSTSHHDDPTNVSEDGDLDGVSQWLSDRLSERLSESAIQLDRGQYDRAKSVLGDDYDSRLDQFVDVAGDTDSERDDEESDTYREARRDQRNLSETVESYEETYESYEEAARNGNETAARQYARRLQRLEDRVGRLNQSLVREYEDLENQTGVDLDRAVTSIVNVSENISARQRQIDEELFTATELGVSTANTSISYADPLVASGQLRTESGDPVADRTVTIQVYRQVKRVETDEDGRFQLRYRPRRIPVNRSSVTVRYVPDNSSAFLRSNATVDVEIEQVTADLSVERAPTELAYRERLDTVVRLELDGEPVTGVPVRATAGPRQFRQRGTNERGIAYFGEGLPASIPAGERQLTVAAGAQNAAVVAPSVNRPLTVLATQTTLSAQGNQTTETRLAVHGQLATADGAPVGDQPVRITVADSLEQTVTTEMNGSYAVTFDASRLGRVENDSVPVTVRFDGQGTNLNASATTARIDYQNPAAVESGEESSGNTGLIPWDGIPGSDYLSPAGMLGLGALLVGLLVVLGLRRRNTETDAAITSSGTGSGAAATAATAGPTGDSGSASTATGGDAMDIRPAEAFLSDGNPQAAVQFTYQRLRQHVADRFEVDDADTHWEFFDKCRDNGMADDQLKTMLALVETYEAVEFHRRPNLDVDVESLLAAVGDQWSRSSRSGE